MKHTLARIAMLTLMILFVFLPTRAQEATPDAAPIAIVTEDASGNTTVEDGGTVINIEAPAPTETPVSSDNSPLAVLAVLAAGFVGIIVALSFSFQAIGNRAAAAVNNPLEIAVLEKAHESIPAPFVQTIIEPLQAALERTTEALVNVTALLKEAGDKTPKASKPTPLANNPTITNIHEAGSAAAQDAEF